MYTYIYIYSIHMCVYTCFFIILIYIYIYIYIQYCVSIIFYIYIYIHSVWDSCLFRYHSHCSVPTSGGSIGRHGSVQDAGVCVKPLPSRSGKITLKDT